MNETKTEIRAFLDDFFDTAELSDSADIFKSGYVTSLFAMQLVLFVENQYGFRVENEDLTLDNFRSVDALASLVSRKAVAAAG